MNDIKEHWDEVKATQAQLDKMLEGKPEQAIYLMSVQRRKPATQGGHMSVATTRTAALMIIQETHRLATPQEISQWKTDQAAKGKQLKAQQAQKDAKVSVDLGPLVNQLIEHNAQAAAARVPPAGRQS